VSLLRFVAFGGIALAVAGCGLDSNGLGEDEAGVPVGEAGSPFDGTIGPGGPDGSKDVTAPPAESGGDVNPGGEDSGQDAVAEDAPTDSPVDAGNDASDSGEDAPSDGSSDTGSTDASDAGEDAACTGTCTTATVPTGWTVVEFEDEDAAAPACSNGYGTQTDIVESPGGGPATCGCSCRLTSPGTCESGNFTAGGGSSLCFGSTVSPANDGGCSDASVTFQPPVNPKLQVQPAPYDPGVCAPDASVATPPVTYGARGRFCVPGALPAGSCPNGGTCAPPPTDFQLCIKHGGTIGCPTGFPNGHTVGTTGDVSDTRGCSACTCVADAGCGGTLTLFTDSKCTQNGQSVPLDDKCDSFGGPSGIGAPTYITYIYNAQTQDEGCNPSPVSPTGSVSFGTTHTICCQ
jgi:hypothetical protein